MSVNLAKYKRKILVKEDKLLFNEVERCAKAGAYRAAYILTWISCAESFKRRFKEAAKRDGKAGPIVGQIKNLEAQKKSVDAYLLNEAEKYGFIDAATKIKLDNIFTSRCIYAHPYEDAPKQEELLSAVCIVVDHVLSQPVRLKEGFVSNQIKEIFGNQNFLDDLQGPVEAYATEILPRISPDCYEYMLNSIFTELDKTVKDASLGLYNRRGTWVARILIQECLPLFPKNDWHILVNNFKTTAPSVLSRSEIFDGIGKKAQDSLVGHLLTAASDSPSVLKSLEKLMEAGSLSERHQDRFFEFIDKFGKSFYNSNTGENLKASGLKLNTCFDSIIAHLKSHNWYTQNPVALMVANADPSQFNELNDNQQQELGRNILQSCDGGAGESYACLTSIASNPNSWPYQFIYGVLVECFVNEKDQFRFKTDQLDKIFNVLDGLVEERRSSMLDELLNEIEGSGLKKADRGDLKECIETMKSYKWSNKFSKKLEKIILQKIKYEDEKALAA